MKRISRPPRQESRKPYEVGYSKPPLQNRFKPGQSGNPRGRPKGSRNRPPDPYENNRLREILDIEANRLITIHDASGKKTEVTTKQALVRSIAVAALKGNQRSQRLFVQLISENEYLEKQEREAVFEGLLKYKTTWTQEFARHRAAHREEPTQLPHPDDVRLDFGTGKAVIAGPATEEEKVSWDRWTKIRAVVEKELKEWRSLQDYPEYRGDQKFARALATAKETLDIIDLALGGSRSVMRFLESLDLSGIEQAMLDKQKRGKRKHLYVWSFVRVAMEKKYIARTT